MGIGLGMGGGKDGQRQRQLWRQQLFPSFLVFLLVLAVSLLCRRFFYSSLMTADSLPSPEFEE